MGDLSSGLGDRGRYPTDLKLFAMNTTADYAKIHDQYAELAHSGIRDYDFYCHVRNDGVSPFNACLLLRDHFGTNLETSLKIKTAHEGYSNAELQKLRSHAKPDRGAYCPKCECHIPAFNSICPETELELRAIDSSAIQMKRLIEITGCSMNWAKIWATHPDGPHRKFGDNDAPPCRFCGKQLRTKQAKQCVECGADWH